MKNGNRNPKGKERKVSEHVEVEGNSSSCSSSYLQQHLYTAFKSSEDLKKECDAKLSMKVKYYYPDLNGLKHILIVENKQYFHPKLFL